MTQDSLINNESISLDSKPPKKSFITNEMLHNGKSILRENLRLFIVLLVLHMAAAPLTLLMAMVTLYAGGRPDVDGYAVIAVLTTGAAVAAGLMCALCAMPYLYKKSVVDMRLSLPMTTGQRFASDFISGLFLYIVPLLISQVVTWLLILIGHILCDGKTFYYGYDYSGYARHSYECHIFEDIAPYMIKGVIGGLAIMLMFYALTVLVASCCGSIFEAACYTIMANGLIPGVLALLTYAFTEQVEGLVSTYYLLRIIPYTSPGGGVFGLLSILENESYNEYGDIYSGLYYGRWLVIFLLFTAVIIAGAYLIYRKRKAEDTGKPVVFGIFYHIIMTLVLVLINCAFYYGGYGLDADIIIPQIITTAIIYMIFHVIRNRGFARFGKGVICYAATMAVTIGSFVLVDVTGLFGAGKYTPSAGSVSAVYTSYNGYFGNPVYMHDGSMDQMSKITDPENIRIITEAHEQAVDLAYADYQSAKYYEGLNNYRGDQFWILYKMKSGRTIVRKYDLYDSVRETLSSLDMTEEFKQIRIDALGKDINDVKETVKRYKSGEYDSYYENDTIYAKLAPQWRFTSSNRPVDDTTVSIPISQLPADLLDRVYENLALDMQNETYEEYFSFGGELMYFIYGTGDWITVPVKDSYSNTVSYLRGIGFEPLPRVVPETIQGYFSIRYDATMVNTDIIERITNQEIITSTVSSRAIDGVVRNGETSSYYQINRYAGIDQYSSELMEIMALSKKQYRSEKSSYTISVNGNSAVIPAEYSDKAERLYIRTVANDFVTKMYDGNYGGEFFFKYYDMLYDNDFYYDHFDYDYSDYGYANERDILNYKEFLRAFIECCGKDDIIANCGEDIYTVMREYAGS